MGKQVNDRPCFGCEDRNIECHSQCEKYQNWKNELERKNEAKMQKKSQDDAINNYIYDRITKRSREEKMR